mmetsp:Transcript_8730/g.20602  ORF Transcript_8730/g.20602 Transcript_8730/m.20602 type:complete len:274 (-) Transcript_8730:948-1769(-)
MLRTPNCASIWIASPFWISAMLPPTCASGVTCPMQKPWVPPEKRPSVISATSLPSPAPMIADVGVNISGMPGPPLGPSYRITTTIPAVISLRSSAASMSSSESNTAAVPLNVSPSLPVILATEPSGAMLPYKTCKCPVFLIGASTGRMIFWPSVRPGSASRFSLMVLPVTVIWESSIMFFSTRYFISAGVPPMFCTSSITYLPEGFMSARNGMRSETLWKSSSVIGHPTALDMAMRWSTALVEPPVAMTMTMAFSKAARVMMSLGLRSISSSL